ncbi:MAG TPA: tRNA (uridine(34)/cytosine(34)/5-carboxymethylaminomethyluridine(34)-2'-O)-methyltransferase TrmL [Nitrosomonas sp.]|uniref:tRNA (uridine(34)/cytosine(34)/5- carboxymethylaminomethyluridine(34)-2'-O)- methyltransferase TrmL n=1 Tax=Nitrosomonas sp. TaxID=42353 RepID=UPI002083E506|nr:tRNA (uridine(34)/cytosine(34)/5-carboxymethylaminomethyluridine(34)-2'-O)-methyltransferase TrmL [Nitrosomonas sp.]GJL75185.1 MAG: tRNA (cytidine(34)-2'-O)-methyltransferase [Nitrosomonas sp.]HNP25724.1 tRNA (uridine(34)/cytosine(34)/5-carboxymethylaminomethyluridine(34)-2'-O)-methyltransferase TrmL [Nitrosomonas sp.]
MFNIILYQPEIPQNTGNIIRLCANTGAQLHLVKPLGFILRDKQLLRAGLDYHEFANIKIHENWRDCTRFIAGKRLFAITTKGKTRYDSIKYTNNDAFLFGSETMGLPEEIISSLSMQMRVRVPMVSNSRSLNLSNTVAIITYEAWRQSGFQTGI